MHYEVKYDLSNLQVAVDKAIEDTKEFLGDEQFNEVVKVLQGAFEAHPGITRSNLVMSLSLTGVQGFPAQAMVDTYAIGYNRAGA